MTLEARNKELEAALAESRAETREAERKLRVLMETVPVGVAILSTEGVIESINDRYLDALPGVRRETILGSTIRERLLLVAGKIVDPVTGERALSAEQEDWVVDRLRQHQDLTLSPEDTEFVLGPDNVLHSTSNRGPDGKIVQTFQNVSDLRQGEQRIRNTIEMLPAAIALFDNEKQLIYFNRTFLETLRPELRQHCKSGKSYFDIAWLVLRSAAKLAPETFGPDTPENLTDAEIDALTRDRVKLFSTRTQPLIAEYLTWDGRIVRSRTTHTPDGGVVNVAVDVTSERRTSKRLAEVIDNIDGAVFLFDENLELKLWSPSAPKLFEFLKPILKEGVHSDDIRDAIVASTIPEDRSLHPGKFQMTYVRRFLDGRMIQIRRVPTADGGLLVVGNDVTEIQMTNLIASRAERIESLGRLVAGLAHEINTPLGVGVTTASFIESETKNGARKASQGAMTGADLRRHFEVITEAAALLLRNLDRAAELVAHFKRVSVDELSSDQSRFKVIQVVDDVSLMLRRLLAQHGCRLIVDCPSDIEIVSYPGAFMQIITNLVNNSILHGYPDGREGTFRLTARRVADDIEIEYSDDGDGVPPHLLGRIFEYFFTTRRGQGGSGLGLSIVHNLVTNQLRGEINAASPPGAGLSIRILIPGDAAKGLAGS